jgi:hypothetical protein
MMATLLKVLPSPFLVSQNVIISPEYPPSPKKHLLSPRGSDHPLSPRKYLTSDHFNGDGNTFPFGDLNGSDCFLGENGKSEEKEEKRL